jgi:hypothetical protein
MRLLWNPRTTRRITLSLVTLSLILLYYSIGSSTSPSLYLQSSKTQYRIAFINGDEDNDSRHVAELLGLKYSTFNPRITFDGEYGQRKDMAEKLNKDYKLGEFFCTAFDIVVVGKFLSSLIMLRRYKPGCSFPFEANSKRI